MNTLRTLLASALLCGFAGIASAQAGPTDNTPRDCWGTDGVKMAEKMPATICTGLKKGYLFPTQDCWDKSGVKMAQKIPAVICTSAATGGTYYDPKTKNGMLFTNTESNPQRQYTAQLDGTCSFVQQVGQSVFGTCADGKGGTVNSWFAMGSCGTTSALVKNVGGFLVCGR